mmetsp:Transcript_24339/g.45330  ORF Transcript_24339/g.45330 Transcript_24339/m.45330 type:complete len:239 (-) Transcript_24339:345-1061(-)
MSLMNSPCRLLAITNLGTLGFSHLLLLALRTVLSLLVRFSCGCQCFFFLGILFRLLQLGLFLLLFANLDFFVSNSVESLQKGKLLLFGSIHDDSTFLQIALALAFGFVLGFAGKGKRFLQLFGNFEFSELGLCTFNGFVNGIGVHFNRRVRLQLQEGLVLHSVPAVGSCRCKVIRYWVVILFHFHRHPCTTEHNVGSKDLVFKGSTERSWLSFAKSLLHLTPNTADRPNRSPLKSTDL